MSAQEIFRRLSKNKFFIVGFFMLIILLLFMFVGPLIVPFETNAVDLSQRLVVPEGFSKGLKGHILGTDGIGQDVLIRLMKGGQISLAIAIVSVILPMILGSILGMLAGYYGGKVDLLIMRINEIFTSLPAMMMIIALMAVLGAKVYNLIIVQCTLGWMSYCRLIRGNILSMRNSEFIKASMLLGSSGGRILFREILPNCMTPIIINASQQIGTNILTEASLSFLGCGVPPTVATWGIMIAEGRSYITYASWTVLAPGLALMFTVLAFSFLGDGIRDVLDPKNTD